MTPNEIIPVVDEFLVVKTDSQILNSMNLCPERYRLEHVENWRPLKKAGALEKGSVMHTMLWKYRIGKKEGRTTLAEHGKLVEESILAGRISAAGTDHITNEDFEEEKLVFQEYVLKWQHDGWEILDIEQPFSRVLYEDNTPIEYNGKIYKGLRIIYEGVVDARIKDPKEGVCVVDSKTESRRSYPFPLSNQFQGYEWAFDAPVIIDKIGFQSSLKPTDTEPDDKGRDKSKYRRIFHRSGEAAIAEWKSDTVEQIKEAIEWHRQLNNGRATLRKDRTSCDKYSGCIFQRVCKEPIEVREYKLIAHFYRDKPWDPYTRDEHDELEQGGES